ncbi:NADH-quinone oxidoreductase subunit N [Buchnera aphidicola (Eriosoma grossulariae)]|uniref:NADH-quinone oxidoreductase subunit N n=1 Tax=Buchnera aphidicola TaxID=9 RepID=UPI003464C11C
MMVIVQSLTALLPVLILAFSVIVIMLSIAWNRNFFLNFILSLVGLLLSFLSLFMVSQHTPLDINFLLRIDNYSILYSGIILFFSFCTCIFSYSSLLNYHSSKDEFYLLILLSTLGCVLLTMAVHMASLFIGFELVSLPLIGLIGYFKHYNQFLESTLKYMILSSLTSALLLFGISLVYIGSGGLSFIELQQAFNISSSQHIILLLFGTGIILISFFFKLSIFPFHLWIPDVYQGATALVLTYFSTVVKISFFIALVRFFLYLPVNKIFVLNYLCTIIAFISILFGNIMALFQNNLKRLLAYSSISHFGYLLIALLTCQFYPYFLETLGIYLLGYCVSNLGIFAVLNSISNLNQKFDIDQIVSYRGFYCKNPFLSVFMTIFIFSLAGIPISLGFISKLFLLTSISMEHFWFLGFSIILGTIISLYYYLKIIIILYNNNINYSKNIQAWNIITLTNFLILLLGMINIFFGLFPNILIEIFNRCIIYL